jgi:hypothetical protein
MLFLAAATLSGADRSVINPREYLAELRRLGARKPFLTDSPDVYLEPQSIGQFFTEKIYRELRGNAYFGYDYDEGFVLEGKTVQIEVLKDLTPGNGCQAAYRLALEHAIKAAELEVKSAAPIHIGVCIVGVGSRNAEDFARNHGRGLPAKRQAEGIPLHALRCRPRPRPCDGYLDRCAEGPSWAGTWSCWQQTRQVSVDRKKRQCGICAVCMLRRMSINGASLKDQESGYVWENLRASSFAAGAAASFPKDKITSKIREYAIAGAHFFSVSREAMVRRLEELGLFKEGTWDWFEDNGGITDESVRLVLGDLAVPDRERADADHPTTLRLNLLAAEAYRRELLSEGQLAGLLGISRVEFRAIFDTSDFDASVSENHR